MKLGFTLRNGSLGLALFTATLSGPACGPAPSEPGAIVHPADPKPNPHEQPQFFSDTRTSIATTPLVREFRKVSPDTYRDGIGYDHQNLLPGINLYLDEATDTVKDRTQYPTFGFVEVPVERVTAHFEHNQDFKARLEDFVGPAASQLIYAIASPNGFYGKSYVFARFPSQDGYGTIDYNTPYLYFGLLGQDAEGLWLGETIIPDTPDAEKLKALIHQAWNSWLPLEEAP